MEGSLGKEVLTNSFGVWLGTGLRNLRLPPMPKGVRTPPPGTLLATPCTWPGSC